MAATYEPIATTTLSSAASSITFSSIASTWTDLKVVLVGTSTAESIPQLRLNSDTGANYSMTYLGGQGSAASSGNYTAQSAIWLNALNGLSPTIPSLVTADIFSYAGSTYKTVLGGNDQDRNGSGSVCKIVGLWRSISAVNAVTLFVNGDTLKTGTTATLYGIKSA